MERLSVVRWSSRVSAHMVAIAQLAERLVVVLKVAGSSPVSHPLFVSRLFGRPRSLLCRDCCP